MTVKSRIRWLWVAPSRIVNLLLRIPARALIPVFWLCGYSIGAATIIAKSWDVVEKPKAEPVKVEPAKVEQPPPSPLEVKKPVAETKGKLPATADEKGGVVGQTVARGLDAVTGLANRTILSVLPASSPTGIDAGGSGGSPGGRSSGSTRPRPADTKATIPSVTPTTVAIPPTPQHGETSGGVRGSGPLPEPPRNTGTRVEERRFPSADRLMDNGGRRGSGREPSIPSRGDMSGGVRGGGPLPESTGSIGARTEERRPPSPDRLMDDGGRRGSSREPSIPPHGNMSGGVRGGAPLPESTGSIGARPSSAGRATNETDVVMPPRADVGRQHVIGRYPQPVSRVVRAAPTGGFRGGGGRGGRGR